jgi:hypothetical protein
MKKLIAGMMAFAMCFSANAALISVERLSNINPFAEADLAAYWSTITPDATETVTDATNLYRGSIYNHTLFKLTASINLQGAMSLDFLAGLDAGYGAEVFINDVLAYNTEDGIWWKNDFGSTSTIALSGNIFYAGLNTFTVFWAEDGKSGGNSFGINISGADLQNLSIESLSSIEVASINAPATVALFLIGAMVIIRRKNQS